MADITLAIAGRSYRLACRDGEEAALRAAAERVDRVATELAASVGAVAEARLLLMTALSLAAPDPAGPPGAADNALIEALASRIEALAGRLEMAAGKP